MFRTIPYSLRILNGALIIAGALFFGWLYMLNFPATKTIEAQAKLGFDTPIISKITPLDRLEQHAGYQGVVASPVYFSVRLPRWFTTLRITITYKEAGRTLHGIGAQTAKGFSYLIKEAESIKELENGSRQVTASFNRRNLYDVSNRIQFLIDSREEVTSGELLIEAISVQAQQ